MNLMFAYVTSFFFFSKVCKREKALLLLKKNSHSGKVKVTAVALIPQTYCLLSRLYGVAFHHDMLRELVNH